MTLLDILYIYIYIYICIYIYIIYNYTHLHDVSSERYTWRPYLALKEDDRDGEASPAPGKPSLAEQLLQVLNIVQRLYPGDT